MTPPRKVAAGNGAREAQALERFFSFSLDLLCIAGMDGYFKRVNPAFTRVLGYAEADLLAQPFLDLVHEDDRAATLAEMEKLSTGAPTLHFENRYRCQDGSYKWLGWTSFPVPEEGRLYAVARDITEQRRIEEELRRWKHMVEHAGWGVVAGSADGKAIVSMNPEFGRMHGYTVEELAGRSIADLFAPGPARAELPDRIRAVHEKGHHMFESEHVRKDGSIFPVLVDATVVRDERGRVLYRIVNVQDITERKRDEEALRRAKADAEAANRELEAFAYSVSHDLRAPLRSIDGFSRVLEEDHAEGLAAKGLDALARIRAAVRRMGALIDALLKLSKVTRAELRPEPVDLGELARAVAEELTEREPGRRIEISITQGAHAVGDPLLLRVALENLLGNAFKFTAGRDPARVEIGVLHQGGEPVFFVRDNGAGFDMQYAGKLFGAFQRLHGAADFPGTGIGLATVQRIVHRHGGRVWAEAAVGEGATFCFTLGGAT
jgi:hypothetical protein